MVAPPASHSRFGTPAAEAASKAQRKPCATCCSCYDLLLNAHVLRACSANLTFAHEFTVHFNAVVSYRICVGKLFWLHFNIIDIYRIKIVNWLGFTVRYDFRAILDDGFILQRCGSALSFNPICVGKLFWLHFNIIDIYRIKIVNWLGFTVRYDFRAILDDGFILQRCGSAFSVNFFDLFQGYHIIFVFGTNTCFGCSDHDKINFILVVPLGDGPGFFFPIACWDSQNYIADPKTQ
jgi:hypothetical protein